MRKAFNEALHPRGFGGKFGHGTGVKKVAEKKAAKAAAPSKYSAKGVTSGGAMKKRPPVAAQKPDFWKFGPPKKGAGPKAMKKAEASKPPKKARKGPPTEHAPGSPGHLKHQDYEFADKPKRHLGAEKDWKITKTSHDGEEYHIADDVAALSKPSDFASSEAINPDLTEEQRQEARKRAREIFVDSVGRAPAIRAAIRDTVLSHNGSMGREYDEKTGTPTAVKTEHSTWRKVQKKMQEKGVTADHVNLADSVRFTAVFDEESYAEGVAQLRTALEAVGYDMVMPPPDINDGKGGWSLGAYRGLNMNFRSADGFEYEVQAHTPKSLEVADKHLHKLYDVSRSNDSQLAGIMADTGPHGGKAKTGIDPKGLSPAQYREKVDEKMLDLAETIPIPKGVTILKTKDSWDKVIRVTTKTGPVSSRTGAPLTQKKTARPPRPRRPAR